MKIGIWTLDEYRNTGIETFEQNTVPWLQEEIEGCELHQTGNARRYPFSVTIQKIIEGKKVEREIRRQEYDKFFIPSQGRMMFDPRRVDAEVIPYIHDILPATAMYKSYSDNSIEDRLSGYLSTLIATRYTKFIARCEKVIVASEETKKDLIERTGFEGEAYVIYQGVDDMPHPSDVEVKERDIDILYVGSLVNRKNPEFLKNVLNKAVEEGYNVHTVNHQEIDLPGENHTNISDRELAELYSRTKYYIHPSLAEGFGRTPVEAQRYGAVPMALDRPINHEILGEGWVQIKDTTEVIEQLNKELDDLKQSKAEENAGKYTWEKTRERIKEVLQSDNM